MTIDTDRFAGELRDRLQLDGLRSDLEFPTVMASSRRAQHRRRVRVAGALAGVFVLGTLASPVGLDVPARVAEAMRSVRLAHVDGLSVDLSDPLHVAWRAQGQLIGVLEPSGTILVGGDGTLEALAPDGSERWSIERGADEGCGLSLAPPASSSRPKVHPDEGAVILCVDRVTNAFRLVDARTGTGEGSFEVGWGPPSLITLVDGDVVASGVGPDGRAAATRWHPDGSVVWSRTAAEPVGGSEYLQVATESFSAVVAGGRAVWIDPASGAERSSAGPLELRRVTLPGGFVAAQVLDLTAGAAMAVRVEGPGGATVLAAPGGLQVPAPDDGSVPGLLIVQGDTENRAFDLSSGGELWHLPLVLGMVLDGRLIGWNADNELQAVDARTGEVLWHRLASRTDGQGFGSAVTDGRTVLTREMADTPALVAVDAATGALRWSVPWDGGFPTTLTAVPGGVLASADGVTTMLRP